MMTDIVERLRKEAEWYFNAVWTKQDGGNDYRLSGRLADEAADEIERLRKEKQELELQYLSDQGQWIEETGRLREALREIAKTDIQTWAKTALEKGDWAIVERIAEVDQQGTACRALAGEKES